MDIRLIFLNFMILIKKISDPDKKVGVVPILMKKNLNIVMI